MFLMYSNVFGKPITVSCCLYNARDPKKTAQVDVIDSYIPKQWRIQKSLVGGDDKNFLAQNLKNSDVL